MEGRREEKLFNGIRKRIYFIYLRVIKLIGRKKWGRGIAGVRESKREKDREIDMGEGEGVAISKNTSSVFFFLFPFIRYLKHPRN